MMQGSFDANQFAPRQSGEGHPLGMYQFTITDTKIVPTKDQSGGMFVVEFTSSAGSISNRYNIWNNNPKAVEIAHGQLSALCHAVGVFKLDWQNEGAALRGARGQMKIDYQKGEEPTAEKPTGGYVEIKKVYDVNGNEPGKAPKAAPQPMQNGQVQSDTAQPWGNGQAREHVGAQHPGQAPWPGPNQSGAPVQPAGTPAQNWQPGPSQAPSAAPPWGAK